MCVCSATQLCPTLCNCMDCRPPGSSVYGILQARTPKWVAIFFSRGSFWLRDQIHFFCFSCLSRQSLHHYCHLGSPYPVDIDKIKFQRKIIQHLFFQITINVAIHVFLIWILWKQTLRLRVACGSFIEKREFVQERRRRNSSFAAGNLADAIQHN